MYLLLADNVELPTTGEETKRLTPTGKTPVGSSAYEVAGLQLPDVVPTSSGDSPPIVPSDTEASEKGVALRAH